MTIKHNFIEFANLVGSINFDDDDAYDECNGWIRLSAGPMTDDLLMYEAFYSPYGRDLLMQQAFEMAAVVMARSAKMNKAF